MVKKIISGAGGGKGGGDQHIPYEAPDSLRSIEHARVVDLVCEGPIEGPAETGFRWVYLDGTVIENADASGNFKDVTVAWAPGSVAQAHLPGFTNVESETAVAVEAVNTTGDAAGAIAGAVVRTITDATMDAVRVTISIPLLSSQNTTNGDLLGTSVSIALDIQTNGGGYVEQLTDTITGKASSEYTRSYRLELPGSTGPWDIRLRRVTIDSGSAALQNATYFARYTQIIDAKFTYPYSAVVGVSVDASQFKRIPTRGYDLKLRKVQIPANYDPVARTYSGIWDGTFVEAWSSNPAWCWYDYMTNKRFGLGDRITPAQIDKWALYTIGQYCDAYVISGTAKRATISTSGVNLSATATTNVYTRASGSFVTDAYAVGDYVTMAGFTNAANNGRGIITAVDALTMTVVEKTLVTEGSAAGRTIATAIPTEPRFELNYYSQVQEQAFRVMAQLASAFRAMAFWGMGGAVVVQDSPSDPAHLITNAHVIDGKFSYSGAGKQARHTVAHVTWNNPANFYRPEIEAVRDFDGIARYGYRILELVATGCTSQGQAHRMGKWLLLTERLETETIAFQSGLEGMAIAPGELVNIHDQDRTRATVAGRIQSATVSSVVLDRPVTLGAGDYTLWATLADGTTEERDVTTGAGTVSTLAVSPNFTAAPTAEGAWILSSATVAPTTYRVFSITEKEPHLYEVVGLVHDATKFALSETIALQTNTAPPTATYTPVGTITVGEYSRVLSTGVQTVLTAAWDAITSATSYGVQYRRDSGNWVSVPDVDVAYVEVQDVDPGDYEVKVTAKFTTGNAPPVTSGAYTVVGKSDLPGNVAGFAGSYSALTISLSWTPNSDVDLSVYEIREGGTGWGDATPLAEVSTTTLTLQNRAVATYTFRIKARDTSGNLSATAASVEVIVGTTTLPTNANIPASQVTNIAAGGIAATDVQAAINELDTEKQPIHAILTALASLAATGMIAFTSTGTPAFAARTITGTADRVSVSNGDGVAGSPTLDIAATYVGQTSITTLGTVATGTWNATTIGLAKGGTNADLSATGGASNVLQQASAGAAITVGQLAASNLSNGTTGSGAVVLATAPTFVTSLTVPLIIGGTSTTQSLVYRTTTGVGITGADHIFQVGNNGSTEGLRITNAGRVGVGGVSPACALAVLGTPGGTAFVQILTAATGSTITDGLLIGLSSDTDGYILNRESGDLRLGTGDVETLRLRAGGNIGAGVFTPTAVLHLKAGTTAVSTAPLKFNTGSLLTAPEAGAVEFLIDAFYGTITTGAARKTFAFLESPAFTTPNIGAATGTSLTLSSLTSGRVTFAGASGVLSDYAGFTYTGGTSTGGLVIPNTTVSTSSTTGCATFGGGIGVAGTIYAGSFIVQSDSSVSGSINKSTTAGLKILGVGGSSYDLSLLTPGATAYIMRVPTGTSRVQFTDTTASASATTGALVVSGGGGFAKSIFAGEQIISTGPTSGIGYGTGAGGTVTQATDKATGVALSKVCGTITMHAASLAADTGVAFTLTNTAIAATDVLVIQHDSGGTLGAYGFGVTPAAGSAVITVHNNTPGALAEAIVLRFVLYKAVAA